LLKEKPQENRREPRVAVAHPVRVANTLGITRDISTTGVFFEINVPMCLGDEINFVIEMGRQGVNFVLKCVGKIVRLENLSDKLGVAVSITDSIMESA
jgi:hypothetical protein